MSELRYLLTVTMVSVMVVSTRGQCSEEDTSKASHEFKACIDKKEYGLLHMDKTRDDKQEFICSELEQMSAECRKALGKCRSREYVDDKMAIHINSISGILLTFHRDISLDFCSVLLTPSPPTIVQQEGGRDAKPAYEPVTSSAKTESVSSLLAVVVLSLTAGARIAKY